MCYWYCTNEIVEVKRMFVKQEYIGKWIAKLLLEKLEVTAIQMGYSEIWLETGDLQPEAIQLYEKCGYSRITDYGEYKENLHNNSFEKVLIAPYK